MHPNIPALESEDQSRWEGIKSMISQLIRRRLFPFVVALLFPEYIVGWAIRQRLVAGKFMKMINQHTDGKEITMVHAFFVIMGGIYKQNESGSGSYPLERYQVASLLGVDIENGFFGGGLLSDKAKTEVKKERIGLPSTAELQDKSKSDWLAKLLALIQTLWFIIQCIARRTKRLPITELEVITLAYAVLNFAIYVAWWDKPSRVDCPMVVTADVKPERYKRVSGPFDRLARYLIGNQDNHDELNKRNEAPNFYSGDPEELHFHIASFFSFLLGTTFGAIHCIDWYFSFTSLTEQKIWRASSLLLTGVPFVGAILIGGIHLGDRNHKTYFDNTTLGKVTILPLMLASPFLLLSYLAARIATIYVALHSLHSLRPEAFIAVQWTNLIPHI